MNLAVAIEMKQNEIVEPVAAAIDPPDNVVCVPVGLDSNQLAADRASAFLSSPERRWSSREGYLHSALFALFEV